MELQQGRSNWAINGGHRFAAWCSKKKADRLGSSIAALRFSNLIAKAPRRRADEAMKMLRQVALIAEAGGKRDLGDGDAIVGQQSLRQIDAPEHDILV